MTAPKISIVTPSFNQGSYIRECLESVALQRCANLEHVVMDGGSSDESVAVLESFASVHGHEYLRWISEKDNGQSHALNKGFRAATGDIIGWLNADDRYRPECFARVLQAFREHPEADIIYGDYTWIDAEGQITQLRREISFSPLVLLYHRVLFLPTTAMFFRRRIIDDGFLLNEDLQFAMDLEFFVRLYRGGCRFQHISHFLADFRFQPMSKTCRNADLQAAEARDVIRRHSRVLQAFPNNLASNAALGVLRKAAALRRYSEKALRGYYFTQFRPKAFRPSKGELVKCEY